MLSRAFLGILSIVLIAAAPVAAQVTVEGRAFGSALELGGTPLGSTADTGPQSASCGPGACDDNTFSVATDEELRDASPIAQLFSGGSTTEGEADDDPDVLVNSSFVTSVAGDATVVVLPAADGAAALEASTSFAAVDLRCGQPPEQSSSVTAVTIGGNPIPIPGEAETTIAEGPVTLRFNRRDCVNTENTLDGTGSIECTTEGLHARLVEDVGLIDVRLSHASAALRDVPIECICPDPADCFVCRNFTGSEIDAGFVENDECPGPNGGDRIAYDVVAMNGSLESCDPLDVTLVARVPQNATIDASSITVDGEPAEGTIEPCPGELVFDGCPGETSSGSGRQCLSVPLGTIVPGENVAARFEADVTDKGQVCVSAHLTAPTGTTPEIRSLETLVAIILDADCPGIVPADRLHTTGSGGCATVPGTAPGAEHLGIAGLLVLWLAARQRRAIRPR